MVFARLFLLVAPLFLTGCLLAPGAFDARMTVDPSGAFTFSYQGEAIIVPTDDDDEDESAGKERDEAGQDDFGRSMDSAMRELNQTLMGGIDPRDEDSLRAFAARLEERRGWNSVEYQGEGVFMVDYAVSGRLDRDFLFPVLPDFLLLLPMFVASPLDDGTVRIEVPALMGPPGDNDDEGPTPESRGGGRFTLVTGADIVSENSATGASVMDSGETELSWTSAEEREERPAAVLLLDRGSA
ncbi:hypothetical protein HFP57_16915 [Parasphingopyxis algicola]|uniref:hypothetical protein n=1 Tax=Parasphingopyxis algicola TaxID=2026624 RepID=UPI0015A34F2F|nr:hypothetical protein [Parasphingopyxis algicola]QLC26550.1 hypothetical protein HFP57_16915 [Parasphingopyxis algicola]